MDVASQARQYFQRSQFAETIALLLPNIQDLNAESLLLLGVSLARLRRTEEAVSAFEAVLSQLPESHEALTWLAQLTKSTDERKALAYAQKAVQFRPEDAKGYSALGACHQYARRMEPAIEAFERAVKLAPNAAEHRHNLGLAYQIVHRHSECQACLNQAIQLSPRAPQSYLALADELMTYGSSQAIEVLSKGIEQAPNSPALLCKAAVALSRIRRNDLAESYFARSITAFPQARYDYAAWLLEQGRFGEAARLYRCLIQEKPIQGVAYFGLLQAAKATEAELSKMRSLSGNSSLGRFESMHLEYSLAKAEEQAGEFGPAMHDYDLANELAYRIHNEGAPLGIGPIRADNRRVQALYERLKERGVEGAASSAPILIVGMIRSGTTLLDQILSSHPEVSSAGELMFWIQESLNLSRSGKIPQPDQLTALSQIYEQTLAFLGSGSARVTDKMPLNFAHVGVIHRALPNAKFLHIRRNPIDTCLSIYTTYFGPGVPFAYDRKNIRDFYLEYLQAVDYWRKEMPTDRFSEIDYEELVSSPEATVRRVLEFCDLPWDEACLHPEANANSISTPSRWQARQGINRRSIERWRKFEPWLTEFADLS